MKAHRPELADVFRIHEKEFLARWRSVLSHPQLRALRAIRDCRTAALGGHLQKCDRCGHRVILYNSCLMESNSLWRVERQKCMLHAASRPSTLH
jgi:transposase-like zinc-binding protein